MPPFRSSSLVPSPPDSEAVFEGTAELVAVLPAAEPLSPGWPIRRIIFIAGAFADGLFEVAGCNMVNGVGLSCVSFENTL